MTSRNSEQSLAWNDGKGRYLVSPSKQKYQILFLNEQEKRKQDNYYKKIDKIFEPENEDEPKKQKPIKLHRVLS